MQLSHLLGAGVLIAAVGFSARGNADNRKDLVIDPNQPLTNSSTVPANSASASSAASSSAASSPSSSSASDTIATPIVALPPAPPVANGHFVLVVEGDRNGLAVTFASKKTSPWAGVPKGFDSKWRASILDSKGAELANVPVDVRPFATDAQSVGKGPRVQGCIVIESKIGLLLNVPAFAAAQSYEFSRTDAAGVKTALGTMSGNAVRDLAGGGR
ncbi:MAG: hypothetical protein ACJAYX_000321 [Planctomycetota bacterium]|jgi:hypothetical protein